MGKEIWKSIPGFPNYEISNQGRVKSIGRTVVRGSQKCFLPECIRKLKTEKLGYITVGLSYSPKKYKFLKIHRLLAQAFIPNPENKPFVNHKNGVKSDNRLENLEWVTGSENSAHALANKLFIPKKGMSHYTTSLTNKDIIKIRSLKGKMSHGEISKMYPITRESVRNIINRKTWKHI